MIVVHDQAQVRALSAAYVAYRDRVVAAGGSIGSAAATQAALDLLAATPAIAQWLDARHGVGQDWYSICGQPADGLHSTHGSPVLGNDLTLSNERTLAGGAWLGGLTPDLVASDSYSWGMRYYQPGPGPASGFLWGNRYGNTKRPASNVWNYLLAEQWRSYFDGDTQFALSLPIGVWQWIWVVKDQATVTAYDAQNNVLGSAACPYTIGELPVGIAGGTDSTGISSAATLRYQTFLRAASALTAAQRAAIQAI